MRHKTKGVKVNFLFCLRMESLTFCCYCLLFNNLYIFLLHIIAMDYSQCCLLQFFRSFFYTQTIPSSISFCHCKTTMYKCMYVCIRMHNMYICIYKCTYICMYNWRFLCWLCNGFIMNLSCY